MPWQVSDDGHRPSLYLAHPVLDSERLRQCTVAMVNAGRGEKNLTRDPNQATRDDLKFRSSVDVVCAVQPTRTSGSG